MTPNSLRGKIVKSLKAKPVKWRYLFDQEDISCRNWNEDYILCTFLDMLENGIIEVGGDRKLYVKNEDTE